MFAAHFAVGLAVAARARRAPMSAVLAGAFLPDLVWIGLATAGVEPSAPSAFFDGWSHSVVSVLAEATIFAMFFAYRGYRVWTTIWLAVLSHVVLDAVIHPTRIQLYPRALLQAPSNLWRWGATPWVLGASHYWWIQFAVIVPLLAIYGMASLRSLFPRNLVLATVLIVLGLHLVF